MTLQGDGQGVRHQRNSVAFQSNTQPRSRAFTFRPELNVEGRLGGHPYGCPHGIPSSAYEKSELSFLFQLPQGSLHGRIIGMVDSILFNLLQVLVALLLAPLAVHVPEH